MTIIDRTLRAPLAQPGARHAAADRRESAPALFRLLSDSALNRAALTGCALPIALAAAHAPAHPITFANAAFESFFGYLPGAAQGEPLDAVVTLSHEAAHLMSGGASGRAPATARRRDGTPLEVELAIGPLHAADGRLTHWVLAFSDRSEIQALRAELGKLRAVAG